MPGKDAYGSGHKYGQGYNEDVDDYYEDDMDDDYYEEEEWEEEIEEKSSQQEHRDAAAGNLADFLVKNPKKEEKHPAATEHRLSAEEKEELEKMRSELEGKGTRNIPSSAAAVRAMHKSVIGDGAEAAAQQTKVFSKQGKLIEEAPEELWDIIMCYLNFHGIVSLASTCEWLRYVATSASCLPIAFKGFKMNVDCQLRKVVDPTVQKKLADTRKTNYRTKHALREAFFCEGVSHVCIELPKRTVESFGKALEFPWNFFDSMRFEAIRQQRLAWGHKQDFFDRDEIQWKISTYKAYDPKTKSSVVKTVRTDPNPIETAKKKEVLKQQFDNCDKTMQQVQATAWIDAFRGLIFDSSISKAVNDEEGSRSGSDAEDVSDQFTLAEEMEKRNSALWWYCAVMANLAAGMPNVALEYLRGAVEPYSHDDYEKSKHSDNKILPKWFIRLKQAEETIHLESAEQCVEEQHVFSKNVPWEMPDVSSPMSKTIGVPQPPTLDGKSKRVVPENVSSSTLYSCATNELLYGEDAWRLLESRITQASFDSDASREYDVTLVDGPIIAKCRDFASKDPQQIDEKQNLRQQRRQQWLRGRNSSSNASERDRYAAMNPSQRRLYKQCNFGIAPGKRK